MGFSGAPQTAFFYTTTTTANMGKCPRYHRLYGNTQMMCPDCGQHFYCKVIEDVVLDPDCPRNWPDHPRFRQPLLFEEVCVFVALFCPTGNSVQKETLHIICGMQITFLLFDSPQRFASCDVQYNSYSAAWSTDPALCQIFVKFRYKRCIKCCFCWFVLSNASKKIVNLRTVEICTTVTTQPRQLHYSKQFIK